QWKKDGTRKKCGALLNKESDSFRFKFCKLTVKEMIKRHFTITILLISLFWPSVQSYARQAETEESQVKAKADIIRATREYKESLEKLLALYESDVSRVADLVEKRKSLF